MPPFLLLVFLFLCLYLGRLHSDVAPYDLPPLPSDRSNLPEIHKVALPNETNIPRNFWMTMKTVPDSYEKLDYNIQEVIKNNPDWMIHLINDTEMYRFMNLTFANTSLLWAFYQIHPLLMAGRADIWRMAVLWRYGGVYLDADSALRKPLSQTLHGEDRMVLAAERNVYHNPFHPNESLSEVIATNHFGKYILVQWCMVSEPYHPILTRFLEYVVHAVRQQFMKKIFFKDDITGPSRLLCTTGPRMFSTAVYEEIRVNPDVSFRNGDFNYAALSAKFKAFQTPDHSQHYLTYMHRGVDLLVDYYRK